jgi:hypothetical protein
MFAPVPGFHRVEGHFAARQKRKVRWIGTSAAGELGVLAAGLLLVLGLILI